MLSKPRFKAEPFEKAIRGVIKERSPSDEKKISRNDPENAKMLPYLSPSEITPLCVLSDI